MNSQTKARCGLAIFFTVLIIGSAYLDHEFMVLRGLRGKHLVFIYMWWVTASSILARLLLRESPHDVSFLWGGWPRSRALLVATALPLAVGFATYGISWGTRLAP